MDDRKSKMLKDEIEKQRREAHAARVRQADLEGSQPSSPSPTRSESIPGLGRTLHVDDDVETDDV